MYKRPNTGNFTKDRSSVLKSCVVCHAKISGASCKTNRQFKAPICRPCEREQKSLNRVELEGAY